MELQSIFMRLARICNWAAFQLSAFLTSAFSTLTGTISFSLDNFKRVGGYRSESDDIEEKVSLSKRVMMSEVRVVTKRKRQEEISNFVQTSKRNFQQSQYK